MGNGSLPTLLNVIVGAIIIGAVVSAGLIGTKFIVGACILSTAAQNSTTIKRTE